MGLHFALPAIEFWGERWTQGACFGRFEVLAGLAVPRNDEGRFMARKPGEVVFDFGRFGLALSNTHRVWRAYRAAS